MAENKKTEAEAFLKKSKNDFPDNSEGYRLLGDFYFANGDLDRATAEYGSLNHDHPRDLQVKKNYMQLLILKNRLDEATKLNDEILNANPQEPDALVYRGEMQLPRGDTGGAVDSLQKAIKNDPEMQSPTIDWAWLSRRSTMMHRRNRNSRRGGPASRSHRRATSAGES